MAWIGGKFNVDFCTGVSPNIFLLKYIYWEKITQPVTIIFGF